METVFKTTYQTKESDTAQFM